MILTDHFVFIHLPKTGGTFFAKVMEEAAPVEWNARYFRDHPTVQDIPKSHRELPVVGMVRNPWSFYVSWYSFLCQKVDDYEYFNRVSGKGTLPFKETLVNIMDSPEVAPTGLGGYTCLINHTYRERVDEVRFVHMERLRGEMLEVLGEIVAVPLGLERALLETPQINRGEHRDPAVYYDEELIALVRQRDRLVFERLGYPDRP